MLPFDCAGIRFEVAAAAAAGLCAECLFGLRILLLRMPRREVIGLAVGEPELDMFGAFEVCWSSVVAIGEMETFRLGCGVGVEDWFGPSGPVWLACWPDRLSLE